MLDDNVDGSRRWCLRLSLAVVTLGALACGGGSSPAPADSAEQPTQTAPADADITLLMMGNSHTSLNALPRQLEALLSAGLPGKRVAATEAPGWMFLDERLADAGSMALLRGRRWTVLVLQAQKYSTTGQYSYSTSEAQSLIRVARELGAMPVMFPEWPRLGVAETERIYSLHAAIAGQQPACVAPIGQAWELALQRHPGLGLYAGDGNHSSPAGAYLTALMLYTTLTGASPLALPALANNGVPAEQQALLRQVAADAAAATAPRQHCPGDAPLGQRP
ncbi:hypothetical protein OOZ63_14315 [Paucibacter sp. PLA-PC-4]|uniref:hypothetical protein n=1 Tax=Paucibacter sp. PLA-PC-4 TaxID=2993655 RepID=UPI002248ADC7|nr:hypothetical protein [Paucibacter sp. PLA-PC-4]MCX2863002.1 hypothetical protein [Paucibacter sp. PLA-PC-4]